MVYIIVSAWMPQYVLVAEARRQTDRYMYVMLETKRYSIQAKGLPSCQALTAADDREEIISPRGKLARHTYGPAWPRGYFSWCHALNREPSVNLRGVAILAGVRMPGIQHQL